MDKENFTVMGLIERAREDSSWEPSAEVRVELVNGLVFQLLNSIT